MPKRFLSYAKTQKPSVQYLSKGGTGCDETLNWWITKALEPVKIDPKKDKPKPKKYPTEYMMNELPPQCMSVLNSK